MEKKLYGLIGRKLGHSYSVPVHNAFGCMDYQLYELEPEEIEGFLNRQDFGGINVTIPYKRDVMQYCTLTDAARAIGSVNTLIRQPNGSLVGDNTDLYGFVSMAKRAGIDFTGKKVVVLGSGGASLAVIAGAREMGAREIVVVSRSGEYNYEHPERWSDGEVLVNATPVGMYPKPGERLVDLRTMPRLTGVLDLIYNPLRTALVLQARELGIPALGGLSMLVWQGKLGEERFFEKPISDDAAEAAMRSIVRDTQNIVLIGMPGSGKTTIGEALGAITGREIVDIDACIVQRIGMSIPEFFSQYGEAAFRQIEREEIAKAGMEHGKIIVTGGGAVTVPENLPSLRQNGRIYQILRPVELLPIDGRPVSQKTSPQELYRIRKPMYEAFRDAMIENNGTPQEAAQKIWSDFCENPGD